MEWNYNGLNSKKSLSFRGDGGIKNWLKTSLAFPTVWMLIYPLDSIAWFQDSYKWYIQLATLKKELFLPVHLAVGGIVKKVDANLTFHLLYMTYFFSARVPTWAFIHLSISTPSWGHIFWGILSVYPGTWYTTSSLSFLSFTDKKYVCWIFVSISSPLSFFISSSFCLCSSFHF